MLLVIVLKALKCEAALAALLELHYYNNSIGVHKNQWKLLNQVCYNLILWSNIMGDSMKFSRFSDCVWRLLYYVLTFLMYYNL